MSKHVEKKYWSVRTADNKNIKFYPIFEVNEGIDAEKGLVGGNEIECKFVDVDFGDGKQMRFNFMDIYMFMYACANEELRQQLNLRVERPIYEIPYELTFKLTTDEKAAGFAKRLVKLPVEELAMSYARSLAGKHLEKMSQKGAPVIRR